MEDSQSVSDIKVFYRYCQSCHQFRYRRSLSSSKRHYDKTRSPRLQCTLNCTEVSHVDDRTRGRLVREHTLAQQRIRSALHCFVEPNCYIALERAVAVEKAYESSCLNLIIYNDSGRS